MARHPGRLIKSLPFKLMLLLYSGTYLTANVLDTGLEHAQHMSAGSTASVAAKLGIVSAVNVGLSLYKDSQFARTFGRISARALPVASYIPFIARDGLTIYGTFNLPQILAPSFPAIMDNFTDRQLVAQIVTPAAMQILATPLHLIGLDIYNRPGRMLWQSRARRVRANWLPATVARMCRIVPAYGLGGVVNARMRSRMVHSLE